MAMYRINNQDEDGPSTFSTKSSRRSHLNFKRSNLINARLGRLLSILIAAFLVRCGGGWLGARTYNHNPSGATTTAVKQQYVSNESSLISSIAKNVGAGVVSVDVTSQVSTPDFFGFNVPSSQESAGTGFIISSDGTIITNRHVVPAVTSSVSVTLADGTRYNNVQILGRTSLSSSLDVAFLKISNLNGKKLSPLTLGDSSKVQVGDRVVAIGNALGQFQNTVTSGIISGFGRDVTAGDQTGASSENLTDLFQTDAAINEGNSGGPLVNINGEVIGINTAIAGDAQNIGFAIPINDVKGLISSVLGEGKLEQPYLGIHYVSLTDDLAYQYNLNVKRGAYIVPVASGEEPSIVPGSPAEKAGLKEKDIITKINNIMIDDKTSLTATLSRFKVGDKVNLTVVRGSKTITLLATLAPAPQD